MVIYSRVLKGGCKYFFTDSMIAIGEDRSFWIAISITDPFPVS
jgi:hypothetical protein